MSDLNKQMVEQYRNSFLREVEENVEGLAGKIHREGNVPRLRLGNPQRLADHQ